MTSITISREFVTFAEAATWADDEMASYLEEGYNPKAMSITEYDDHEPVVYNVYLSLEKKD